MAREPASCRELSDTGGDWRIGLRDTSDEHEHEDEHGKNRQANTHGPGPAGLDLLGLHSLPLHDRHVPIHGKITIDLPVPVRPPYVDLIDMRVRSQSKVHARVVKGQVAVSRLVHTDLCELPGPDGDLCRDGRSRTCANK